MYIQWISKTRTGMRSLSFSQTTKLEELLLFDSYPDKNVFIFTFFYPKIRYYSIF